MRLIDADALMERAWRERLDTRERIAEMIGNAPTITDKEVIAEFLKQGTFKIHIPEPEPFPEPVKRGKWEPVTNGRGGFECSICHSYAPSYQDGVEWLSLYCPNCGAKMNTP